MSRPPATFTLTNLAGLVTNDPAQGDGSPLGLIENAALVVEDGHIAWVGPTGEAPAADETVDAGAGRAAVPGFVDSHSHLLYAGDRTQEFNARMSGRPYTAGGIRTTVQATREASDAELAATLGAHLAEMAAQGTTTVETKSGYGLTAQHEARALRVAAEAGVEEVTYLGAHIVPPEYAADPDAYTALVAGEMLDACAPHARWVDVFCEQGAFDEDQSRAILTAGRAKGLVPRGARQPADARPRGAARRRAGGRLRRPLHPPGRRGHRRAGPGQHGRHTAAGVRVLHPRRLPGRAPAAGRGRHRRAVHRLQPRLLVHLLDAVLHCGGGAGDEHDARRSPLVGDGGRRPRPAPHRRRTAVPPGPAPTSPCSTPPRTSTSPTGRGSPSSPTSGGAACACAGNR